LKSRVVAGPAEASARSRAQPAIAVATTAMPIKIALRISTPLMLY
jgi:hypothetical protein